MPANTDPIYTLTPNIGRCKADVANVRSDGGGTIGTDVFLAFTAGANGSWVSKVQVRPTASVAATATTGTVIRVYLSTVGSGATTPGTNVWLLAEYPLPTTTADSTSTPANPTDIPLNMAMPTATYLLVSTHHIIQTNTSNHVLVVGGDY